MSIKFSAFALLVCPGKQEEDAVVPFLDVSNDATMQRCNDNDNCFEGTDGLGLMVGTYKAQCGKGFLWVSWRGKCLRKSWKFQLETRGGRSVLLLLPRNVDQGWSKQGQSCHPVSLIQRCLQDTHRKPGEHSSLGEKDISQLVFIYGSCFY